MKDEAKTGQEYKPNTLVNNLSPFLKWPGGKSSELAKIDSCLPEREMERYIDPFVGGGAVLLAINPSTPALVNDVCPELISIYNAGKYNDVALQKELERLSSCWSKFNELDHVIEEIALTLMKMSESVEKSLPLVSQLACKLVQDHSPDLEAEFRKRLTKDFPIKVKRISRLQEEKNRLLPINEYKDNLEGSLRAAFYMSVRERYNRMRVAQTYGNQRTADFFFLREYCYASMFRFNSKNEFNIPYGGISYNKKSFSGKVHRLFSDEFRSRFLNTEFYNEDFESFVSKISPKSGDFMFVDPPYDSDFTDYDGRAFGETDQYRLADYLSQTRANVMIVIGDTKLIRSLYRSSNWNIREDDFSYRWTIKSRNERKKTHLTITNY